MLVPLALGSMDTLITWTHEGVQEQFALPEGVSASNVVAGGRHYAIIDSTIGNAALGTRALTLLQRRGTYGLGARATADSWGGASQRLPM